MATKVTKRVVRLRKPVQLKKLAQVLPHQSVLMALLLKVKPRDDLFNVFNQQHSVL
jgi:hypothetical protein